MNISVNNARKSARLWLLAWLLWPAAVVAASPAADAGWLYTVEVPIQGQSTQDRQEAAGVGLLQVLTRLTGLTSVPRNAVVAQAIANPTRLYSAFDYIAQNDGPAAQRKVRIVFQPESVLQLMRQASLPVWWEQRPQVLVWVVVQEGGQRRLLSDADRHPLIAGLHKRAQARGVRTQLPMMDLQDALEISAADVWGRVSASVERASARYNPGLVVVGRFNTQVRVGIRQYTGHWEIWKNGARQVVDLAGQDADTAGSQGIDAVAQMLVEQYAVFPRGERQTSVLINQVGDMQAYAKLMSYLQGLTFLQQVQVRAVRGDQLLLHVYGQADVAQLEFLLTSQNRLRVDEVGLGRSLDGMVENSMTGAEIALNWHG